MNLIDILDFKTKPLETDEFNFGIIDDVYCMASSIPKDIGQLISSQNESDLFVITPELYLELEKQVNLGPNIEHINKHGEVFIIKQRFTRYRNAHVFLCPIISCREIWFLHSNNKDDDEINIRLKFIGKIYKND